MTFQKLLKWTIAEALDEVWSKSGVSPSKKTRKAIIKAAEKISQGMDDDFISANKEYILMTERWEDLVTCKHRRYQITSPQEILDWNKTIGQPMLRRDHLDSGL